MKDERVGGSSRIGGTVPILTYHSLDESGSVISVSPRVFIAQMRRLAERGYRGISLSALLEAWDGRGTGNGPPASGKVVVITFDDAFANVLEHAAPVLAEVGFGATVFAVSDYCGKRNDWPGQGGGVPILPLMDDGQLRQWVAAGWEIGAHTKTHPRLAGLSEERIAEELGECQEQLRERLGQAISTVAYPYGSCDRRVRDVAAGLYQCAVTVEMRTARRSDDPWALPRLDAYYWRNPKVFEWFGTAMGSAYLGARSLGRRCRGLLGQGAT